MSSGPVGTCTCACWPTTHPSWAVYVHASLPLRQRLHVHEHMCAFLPLAWPNSYVHPPQTGHQATRVGDRWFTTCPQNDNSHTTSTVTWSQFEHLAFTIACNILRSHSAIFQLAQSSATQAKLGVQRRAHITPLFCELHWIPVCYWVQLKVLVMTYKALHCIGPGFLQNQLCPITLAHPTQSGMEGILQTRQLKNFEWWDLGREPPLPLLSPYCI